MVGVARTGCASYPVNCTFKADITHNVLQVRIWMLLVVFSAVAERIISFQVAKYSQELPAVLFLCLKVLDNDKRDFFCTRPYVGHTVGSEPTKERTGNSMKNTYTYVGTWRYNMCMILEKLSP